jgi:AcrR family transcriptional regulator
MKGAEVGSVRRETRNETRSAVARDRVLRAAVRAFADKGYRGSSLASIAAEAGLTPAGLLHHYPSKEHLLVAVLAERDRTGGAQFHLADVKGIDILDALEQLVRANAMAPGLVQAFTVLMGESVGSGHPARAWFQERYPRRRGNIARALRDGIDMGQIRGDVDCEALSAEIVAMMDGLQVQWLLDPQRIDLGALFAHYIDGVRRSIRVESAPGDLA